MEHEDVAGPFQPTLTRCTQRRIHMIAKDVGVDEEDVHCCVWSDRTCDMLWKICVLSTLVDIGIFVILRCLLWYYDIYFFSDCTNLCCDMISQKKLLIWYFCNILICCDEFNVFGIILWYHKRNLSEFLWYSFEKPERYMCIS